MAIEKVQTTSRVNFQFILGVKLMFSTFAMAQNLHFLYSKQLLYKKCSREKQKSTKQIKQKG